MVSGAQINLTWTDRSAAEAGYSIERSANGTTGWTQVGTAAANATSFVVPGPFAPSTTYYFRIGITTSPPFSAPTYQNYSATVPVTTPAYPDVPASVTATAAVEGTIALAWADTTGETGYRVERSGNGTSGWTQVGTAPADATGFQDTGLPENTRYYYRLIATNAAGDAAPSATATAMTLLATPGSLAATLVSGGQIDLTWTDRSAAESGYLIEQSPDGLTGWKQVGSTAANATRYSATGPFNPSTSYYFRVRTNLLLNNQNYYSTYAPAVPVTTTAYPLAPRGERALGSSDSQVTLTWEQTAGATGYLVQRLASGTWATVGTVGAGVTTFVDGGLTEATTYGYRIAATNAAGISAPTATLAGTALPSAPTNLVATAVSGLRIDLDWVTHSTVTTYFVEHSTDNGSTWQPLQTLYGAGTNHYAATGPFEPATTYSFRVRAFGVGFSSYATTSVVSPSFPESPANVQATVASYSAITVSWTDVADETGYRVERQLGNGTWVVLGTTPAGVTSFTDTNLAMGVRYAYRVAAFNGAGDSSYGSAGTTIVRPTAQNDAFTVSHDHVLSVDAAAGCWRTTWTPWPIRRRHRSSPSPVTGLLP